LNLEKQEQHVIPLSMVEGAVLAKVIEYCKIHESDTVIEESEKYTDERSSPHRRIDDMEQRDMDYIPKDQSMLIKLINAANYLEAKSLLDLLCKRIANMIKGKTVEQIRCTFGIQSDFTPEEEELIRKENLYIEELDMDKPS
jgi:hypothetical protein